MKTLQLVAAATLVFGGIFSGTTAASARGGPNSYTCSGGSVNSPVDIPPGSYASLTIANHSFCDVKGGDTVAVNGNVTIKPGSFLDVTSSKVTGQLAVLNTNGNIRVGVGAALALGCGPTGGCPTASSDHVNGNILADHPLALLIGYSSINGNVTVRGGGANGGGGDTNCNGSSFGGGPLFSDFANNQINGNLTVSHYQACWLGFTRDSVNGSLGVYNNALNDPDAIEILSNHINGNLGCSGNAFITTLSPYTTAPWQPWESVDQQDSNAPRIPEPNAVNGKRTGQCTTPRY